MTKNQVVAGNVLGAKGCPSHKTGVKRQSSLFQLMYWEVSHTIGNVFDKQDEVHEVLQHETYNYYWMQMIIWQLSNVKTLKDLLSYKRKFGNLVLKAREQSMLAKERLCQIILIIEFKNRFYYHKKKKSYHYFSEL